MIFRRCNALLCLCAMLLCLFVSCALPSEATTTTPAPSNPTNPPLYTSLLPYADTDTHSHAWDTQNTCACGAVLAPTPNLNYQKRGNSYAVSATPSITDALLVIPAYYNELPVTEIMDFTACTNAKALYLPDTVTSISPRAFENCSALQEIRFSKQLKTIGDYAFTSCGALSVLDLPQSLTTLGTGAFSFCVSLHSVWIPTSVSTIPERAFLYCSSLTNLEIAPGPTAIGDYAFAFASDLQILMLPSTIQSIGKEAFASCTSLVQAHLQNGLKTIGSAAFRYCNSLSDVTFPPSLTDIAAQGFCATAIKKIFLPSTLTGIRNNTFNGCTDITFYIQATKKPSNWSSEWNANVINATYVWNCNSMPN